MSNVNKDTEKKQKLVEKIQKEETKRKQEKIHKYESHRQEVFNTKVRNLKQLERDNRQRQRSMDAKFRDVDKNREEYQRKMNKSANHTKFESKSFYHRPYETTDDSDVKRRMDEYNKKIEQNEKNKQMILSDKLNNISNHLQKVEEK